MRRPRSANAETVTVLDYGPDPADRFTAARAAEIRGRLNGEGTDPIIGEQGDGSIGVVWMGDTPPMQHFAGAAQLVGGAHPFGGQANLDSAPGMLSDPADRIFAERLRRRS